MNTHTQPMKEQVRQKGNETEQKLTFTLPKGKAVSQSIYSQEGICRLSATDQKMRLRNDRLPMISSTCYENLPHNCYKMRT